MAKSGRPRALADREKRREVCAMVAAGAGLDAAARYAGCSVWTIRREARRDAEFAQRLHNAQSSATLLPLLTMRTAAGSNWRAAAWLLERCFPDQFGRRPADSVAPDAVRTLLDEVANIMADECEDEAQLRRMCRRLKEVQEAHFGPRSVSAQGPPAADSEVERFMSGLDREQQKALEALRIASANSPPASGNGCGKPRETEVPRASQPRPAW